eukprot:TRINITY_DN8955_c0_g1_i2.p1 TRINITY_DN8955_c0_g1~~TRINITY_DN8955_c0_g1_i2.p1  ORF type:complete len:859 (+),score=281.61 TRINITY_DN8955_c0_g1_i2:242-2578(+)
MGVVIVALLHLVYKVVDAGIGSASPKLSFTRPDQIGLTPPTNPALRWLTPSEKDEAASLLNDIVDTVHPTYLIPALLGARAPTQDPFKGRSLYPKHLSDLLDRVVVRPHGVKTLADALLAGVSATEEGGYIRIVNAVAKCPSTIHSAEAHYKLLAPQVLSLWSDVKIWRVPHFQLFVPLLVQKLTDMHPRLARKYLIDPLTRPFLLNGKYSATDVAESVERMHRMIHEVRKDVIFKMYGPVFEALLKMHATVYQSPLMVKDALLEILQKLVHADPEKSRLVLLSHILSAAAPTHGIKGLPMLASGGEGYHFAPSPTGGVMVTHGPLPPVDTTAAVLHLLLSLSEKSPVPGDILMNLLAEHKSDPANVNVMTLACKLIEKLGFKCLKNGNQAISLILFLLNLGLAEEGEVVGGEEAEDRLEGMTTGLSLLELALTDKLMVQVDRSRLAELKETLGRLSSPEPEIGQMIAGCKLGLNRLESRLEKQEGAQAVDESSEELLTTIFGDLSSTQTAFKGHALIALKHFVMDAKHRAAAEGNFTAIFDSFTAYVNDGESFLFLPAINGLVAMCDAMPEKTLPLLLEHYRPYESEEERREETVRRARMQVRDHKLADEAAEEDRVVKLCDVLVYCVWRAGEGVRHGVADALVLRCHYKQTELVRASALQGLASLATHSIWSLMPHLDTLCLLAFDVISLDKSILCRRAAASLLYHLLCSLGYHAVTLIEDHLPKILDIARGNLRHPDAVFAEYFRLLLEEANSIRLNLHNAPEHSLFSKIPSNKW